MLANQAIGLWLFPIFLEGGAMQHKITTLPRQVSSDELEPGPSALPTQPARAADGVAAIASFKKRRRDPSDPESNSDFEEICGLITERFTRNGALDPEFCRFVGLLPDLRQVKDLALVREAKIIAGYLSRDDLQPPTAQQIVGGLADRLRPLCGLPALHVMFGVLLFLAALLMIDLILSYF